MQDFRFPMLADVYYATEVQGEYGQMDKTWTLGRPAELCELKSDKFNSDTRYSILTKTEFFEFPVLLFGRFKNDIRQDLQGLYHPITAIMVTNIRRDCQTEQTPIFLESSEGAPENASIVDDMDILFEVRSFQPFTNPWGKIEYYRTQIYRMDDQNGDEVNGGYIS